MSSNKNEEVLDRACTNFNRQVKKLMSIICTNAKRDFEIDDIRQKVLIAMDVDDRIAINSLGPYIYEYKQYIDNDSFGELLKNDVINLKKYNAEDATNMRIFNILKKQYIDFDNDEKDVIHNIIKNALNFYIMFSC